MKGAKDEGFQTICVCTQKASKVYQSFGVADEILVFEEFERGDQATSSLQFTSELILKGENEPEEKSALDQDGIWFTLNGEKIQERCWKR